MLKFWNNPILRRELKVNVRSRKAVAFVLLLTFILSAVILLLWPRTGVFAEANTDEIFTIFLTTNLALIILMTPGFTATAITDERENESFALLFSSLLRPHEILAGKLIGSLAMAFILLIISLPVTAILALSGGISISLLVRAYVVIMLATLTYGLFGLAVSALCQRSFTSLLLTYVGILILAGATWLPSVLLSNFIGAPDLWQGVRSLSPFEALFALNFPERYELVMHGFSAGAVYQLHLLGMLTVGLACLAAFCFFVLRPPRPRRARTQRVYTDARTSLKRKLGFPFYLIDPLKRKKPIGRFRNPVFLAELRSKVFGKPKFIVRSVFACIILSLVIMTLITVQYATALDAEMVRLVAIVFQVGVVALFAPAVCSGSITDEVTSNTLPLLRMTPLSTTRVVAGKIKAGFAYVLIFLIASLPVLLVLAYLESEASYWRVVAWVGVLILSTVFFVSSGLLASSVAGSTGSAAAVSYAVSAGLCLGTLSVLLFSNRLDAAVVTGFLTFNPLVAALQITSDEWFADYPLLFGNALWQNHLIILGSLTILAILASALRVRHILRRRV